MLWVCSPLDDPDWNFTSPSKAPCRQKGEIALCSVPLLHPNMVSASREQWLKKDFKNRHYLSSGRAIKRNTSQVVSVNTITLQIQGKKKQITLGRPDLQTGLNDFTMLSLPLSHTSTKLHTCTHSHTYILPHKQKFVDMHMSSLTNTYTHTHTQKKKPPAHVLMYRHLPPFTFLHIFLHCNGAFICAHTHTRSIKCKHSMITAEEGSDLSMLSVLGFILERNTSICSRPTVFRSSEYNHMNLHS